MISDDVIYNEIDTYVLNVFGSSFEFRKHQREQIYKIIDNIVNDSKPASHKNYVIEAPTGSGKSIIILTAAGILARYHDKSSYILCSDLFLWNQYETFIKKHDLDYGVIKGQTGNYECARNHEDIRNSDCRMAGIPWKQLFFTNSAKYVGYPCACKCEYVQCRKKCLNNPVVVMTYQMFLYQMNMPDGESKTFTEKDVIFCDECHNIPDIVQQKFSPTLSQAELMKFIALYEYAEVQNSYDGHPFEILNSYQTKSQFENELQDIYKKLSYESNSNDADMIQLNRLYEILQMLADVSESIQQKAMMMKAKRYKTTKDDKRAYRLSTFFKNYMCYTNDFRNALSDAGIVYLVKQLVFEHDSDVVKTMTFHCAKEDLMVSKFLLMHADYRVMLSATIGDIESFSDNIGLTMLDDTNIRFERIPSTFDFSQSPIYADNKCKMSYSEKTKSFPVLKAKLFDVIQKHKNQRGMIQTGSYQLASEIFISAPTEIRNRLMFYTTSKEKDGVIEKYKNQNDAILIGPTLYEGIDLPDDGCRFIVIFKVPYPSLADKLVKRKMELFPRWYQAKTSNTIIQGIGRGIRNDHDWCVSYILDACFIQLYIDTHNQYPDDINRRLQHYSE